MYKKEIAIGEKFGEWEVIEQLKERKNGYIQYKVKCSCGTISIHNGNYLRDEKSLFCRSCSAKKRIPKKDKNKFYRHGARIKGDPRFKTYSIWLSMKQRCENTKCRDYKNYGGRGISLCEKWRTFEGFFEDMGIKPECLSLERVDNDGNYEKENCRWASKKEQNNNRRDNTTFFLEGIKVTRTQIQEKMNWTRDEYRRRQEKYGIEWILEQYKL